MQIAFDARVIQDHFPGIGRYARNLLAELPSALDARESLIILYDPTVTNTRLPLDSLRARITGESQWQWLAWPIPIFGAAGLTTPLPVKASVAHFPYYLRPVWARCPSITNIHDALFLVHPQLAPSARSRLLNRLLNGLAMVSSQRIIALSRSAAQDVIRFFPGARRKLQVIAAAADPLFTPRDQAAQTIAREKFMLPGHFSFYLASNKPHKNLVRLVEAWGIVIQNWSGAQASKEAVKRPFSVLVIAGHQDPRYPDAQLRAQTLGIDQYVKFIGAISDDDAAALYSACDLFVFPSLSEGFGLTPLEAMACGAPVACSNISAMPEVAGDAATLFDPTYPAAIAATCLSVLQDDARRSHMRARSLAQAERFSWREAARLTVALYRDTARV